MVPALPGSLFALFFSNIGGTSPSYPGSHDLLVWDQLSDASFEPVHLDCLPVFSTALAIQPGGKATLLFTGARLSIFTQSSKGSHIYMDGQTMQMPESGDPCTATSIEDLASHSLHNLTIINDAETLEPFQPVKPVVIFARTVNDPSTMSFGRRASSHPRRALSGPLNSLNPGHTIDHLTRRSDFAGPVAGGILGGGLAIMLIAFVVYIIVRARRGNPPERVMRFDYEHARLRNEIELRRQTSERQTSGPTSS